MSPASPTKTVYRCPTENTGLPGDAGATVRASLSGQANFLLFAPGECEGAETHGKKQQDGRLGDQYDIIPIDRAVALGIAKEPNADFLSD